MAVEVDFTVGALTRHVRAWTRDQVPFAISLALNETVRDAQDELRLDLPKTFTIRNQRTARGVRTERSDKRNLEAAVGSIDRYMAGQTVGGERTGADGGGVSVPIGARPNKTSKTPPSKWPGALAHKGAFFVSKGSKTKHGKAHHLAPKRSTRAVLVFMPDGRRKRKLRLMWVLYPSVQLKERWPLEDTLDDVARKMWTINMRHAWQKAIRSAKRRGR